MWFSRFFQELLHISSPFHPLHNLTEFCLAGISGKDYNILAKSESVLLKARFSRPAHLYCGKDYHHKSRALFAWSQFLWFPQLEGNQRSGKDRCWSRLTISRQQQLHMFEIMLWFVFQFDFYCLFGLNTCHSHSKARDHKGQCSLISYCFNNSLL